MKKRNLPLLLALSSVPSLSHGALGPWSLEVETGLGYDSNAYLSPTGPYFDAAANQQVDPQVHSGVFVPLDFQFELERRKKKKLNFVASYDFSADFYPGSSTENADRVTQELKAGIGLLLRRKKRHEDVLTITPYIGSHDKTYFDRDTGEAKVSSVTATDLSERYSYTIRGVEAELDKEIAKFPFKIQLELAQLDYEDPSSTNFDSYDHDYMRIGADADFPINKRSKFKVSYDYYTRDYDERNDRDLDGNLVNGTARHYTYNKAGVSLRNRIGDDWTLYLDYDFVDRRDDYLGYYDYTENAYGFRLIYRSEKKFKVKAKMHWWDRNYENAFAFYEPTEPHLTYEGAEARISGEYALDRHHGLWTEWDYRNQDSSDARYAFDRYQAMVGYRWER